jgi:hypothetical protein
MHELTREISSNTLKLLHKFPRMSYDKWAMDVSKRESKRTRSHLRNTVNARLAEVGLDKSELEIDKDAIRYESKVLGKIADNKAQEYMNNLPAEINIGGQSIRRPSKKYGSNFGAGFEPTREQRDMVYEYVYSMVSLDTIAGCVINPETGNPITTATLKKAFEYEISRARAERDSAVFKMAMATAMSGDKSAPAMLRALINAGRIGYDRKLDLDVEATKKKEDREKGHEEIVIDDADYEIIRDAYKALEDKAGG